MLPKSIHQIAPFSFQNSKIFQLLSGPHPPSDTLLCVQARNWRWRATRSSPPMFKTDLRPWCWQSLQCLFWKSAESHKYNLPICPFILKIWSYSTWYLHCCELPCQTAPYMYQYWWNVVLRYCNKVKFIWSNLDWPTPSKSKHSLWKILENHGGVWICKCTYLCVIFGLGLSQREYIFDLEVPNELIYLKLTLPLREMFLKSFTGGCVEQCSLEGFWAWANSTKFDKIGGILVQKSLTLVKNGLNYQEKASFFTHSYKVCWVNFSKCWANFVTYSLNGNTGVEFKWSCPMQLSGTAINGLMTNHSNTYFVEIWTGISP